MISITHADGIEVLFLQAASDGRGDVLFGESYERARNAVRSFVAGKECPSVYLEFPLIGEPFLDVTVLYGALERGMRPEAQAVADMGELFDWYADVRAEHEDVSFGFEIDTKDINVPQAAIHFQPRAHTELVEPFCKLIGEEDAARLYLAQNDRMPEGWKLSFFGMFRGRPGSPLRVCGYMSADEAKACNDPVYLRKQLDAAGFGAYDDAMLAQVSELLCITSGTVDFQLDVYPDGTLGDIFAIDVQLDIQKPELVRANFDRGPVARLMSTLEAWGAADERWHLVGDAAFARAIPAADENGDARRYAFTLMPQWVKVRWKKGVLQQSKLYHCAHTGFLNDDEADDATPSEGA